MRAKLHAILARIERQSLNDQNRDICLLLYKLANGTFYDTDGHKMTADQVKQIENTIVIPWNYRDPLPFMLPE